MKNVFDYGHINELISEIERDIGTEVKEEKLLPAQAVDESVDFKDHQVVQKPYIPDDNIVFVPEELPEIRLEDAPAEVEIIQ